MKKRDIRFSKQEFLKRCKETFKDKLKTSGQLRHILARTNKYNIQQQLNASQNKTRINKATKIFSQALNRRSLRSSDPSFKLSKDTDLSLRQTFYTTRNQIEPFTAKSCD